MSASGPPDDTAAVADHDDAGPHGRRRGWIRDLLEGDQPVRRGQQHETSEVDGEQILVDVDEGVLYGFDDIGREIWEALSEPRRPSEIVERLLDQYDVDRDTCRTQTNRFLFELLRARLLEPATDAAP